MSRSTDIFIGTDEPTAAVRTLLEEAFGATFTQPEDDAPYLVTGSTDIYVSEEHDFFDDDIEGTWVPLESDYPYWIEVRDIDKDLDRQRDIAQRVFDALKQHGGWKLVYLDDFQHVVDSYDPAQPAEQQAR